MKHIKLLLLSLASSFAAIAADVDVSSGQLEQLLKDDKLKNETELTLRGTIDARDLAAFENMGSTVTKLDLSGVKIEGLTMPDRKYFGRTLFNEGEIPPYTFFKTSLKELVLPESLSAISDGAFAGSQISEIIIPEGVTSIGDYAFYGCPNLTIIKLPSSLKSIGKAVFGNCTNLASLDMGATGITEIPEKAFAGAVMLESLTLPATIDKIGREAFSHTKIKSLNLNNVSKFEAYALSGMPYLEELSLNYEAEIGEGLLMDDISLASLSGIPANVPDYFASNCSNLSAEKAGCGSTLGKYSFANTKAPETLVLSRGVTKINRGAFYNLGDIKKIDVTELGADVPEVDEYTFEGLVQPDIVLWVDDDSFDAWENHPVWQLFQVKSTNQTGVAEIGSETSNPLSISYRNGLISVESTSAINDVRIFTTEGRIVYIASPGQEKADIDTASFPAGVLIVAASDEAGDSKTISILLK